MPNAGPWLGRPMADLKINDIALQRELSKLLFDELNNTISNVASTFTGAVTYVDIRNSVPVSGWFDECHPTNPYFADIAIDFIEQIRFKNQLK